MAKKTKVEFLTHRISRVVQITGLSRSRVYELMQSGELERLKFGGITLVTHDSLLRLIESRRHHPQPAPKFGPPHHPGPSA